MSNVILSIIITIVFWFKMNDQYIITPNKGYITIHTTIKANEIEQSKQSFVYEENNEPKFTIQDTGKEKN